MDAVDDAAAPDWLSEIPAVQVLRRAWAEQYHRGGEGVCWREGKDLPPARDRLSSPYDTDAHYGIKRGAGWCGYKVHLSETCEPDAPHLITNVETTNATVNDTEVTAVLHQRLARRELAPREHVVDAGYVTAAHILAARDEHGIDLLGPVGMDTHHSGRDAQAPDLTQAAFTTDWDAKTVTCPGGAASVSWSEQRKASATQLVRVHFALADCDPCPLRARCTKAANGKWGRSLTLLPQEQQQILEQRRAEQQTDEWKKRYDVRAGVEGTISQAVRRTRLRRHPLPRPEQDPSRERSLRHRPQHHPRRRLAARHPTRHDPCLPPRPSRPCSMT